LNGPLVERRIPPDIATMIDDGTIEAGILRLTGARGAAASISPSEVAQALAADWRPLLGRVRRAAARLAETGQIDILRKGKPIDPAELRGVIRLRKRADGAAP
jgi:hypothetical protein